MSAAQALLPGPRRPPRVEFEPAIGPAAPDRYPSRCAGAGRVTDAVRHAVTLHPAGARRWRAEA